jgi:predicted acetylornithine/succinylornithine family transaminase
MSNTQDLLNRAKEVLVPNYARQPVVMSRGEGIWVWDTAGKKYMDLFAGFGGGILGHCHPALAQAITEQSKKLWHVGNSFYNEVQIELAERLNKFAFEGMAFFCHGGADANETACKVARLRGAQHSPKRWKIITLLKSFHGRTLAMIAATGNPKVREGFDPVVPGFINVEPGSFDALVKAIDSETAGIMFEPLQGEGGVNPYPPDYPARVRKLCDERGLTLIFDEVWTGCGRTGQWFGHQHYKDEYGKVVLPDIMTLGKAIGGGIPVGAMFARPEVGNLLTAGKHGSTIGGNAIGMAVAKTVFDVIDRENLVEHAAQLGEHALARLRNEKSIQGKVDEFRGRGLFMGVELKTAPEKFMDKALARGVIINLTQTKVIRIAPPINITRAQLDEGLDAVIDVIVQC